MTLPESLSALAAISERATPTRRIPHAAAIAFAALSETMEGRVLRREPFAPLDGARMARKRMFFSSRRAIEELGLPQSPVSDALREAVAWWQASSQQPERTPAAAVR
jgi:dihydroflavonol-4-reductase